MKNFLKTILQKCRARLDAYDETHNFTCDVCGAEVFRGERICARCRAALPWNDKIFCPYCGRRLAEAGVCLDCKERRIDGVEKARSAFVHEKEARELVLRFKHGERYLYQLLAELLLPLAVREFPDADAVTFVPMTKRAQRRRGFNQSERLAAEIAKRWGKELIAAAEKCKDTAEQKTLGRRGREENLKGCFHVTARGAVAGRTLLLVDDTLTTGATAGELASRLLRAGAKKVYLLTVTSVPDEHPYGITE